MNKLTLVLCIVLLSTTSYAYGAQAGQLYAVIVNGGRNRLTNHERYWNDCAFLYRMLRNTYHVPQRNITVLMSDGGDPERDMLKADGSGFTSSPVDLDGDGRADVNHPATSYMVVRTLMSLANQLTEQDHLLLFIVDHGGSNDEQEDSFLWLWNEERLNDHSLSLLLNQFQTATVSVLMGQCYSGGFIAELEHGGRVVATACSGSQQSWNCPDREYDEFIYHWLCAMNGADENGTAVHADENGDGRITMAEAFRYARCRDRRDETPQYASWPEDLGERLTLFGLTDTAVSDITADHTEDAAYTLSGLRVTVPQKGRITIVRRDGKIMKIVR